MKYWMDIEEIYNLCLLFVFGIDFEDIFFRIEYY